MKCPVHKIEMSKTLTQYGYRYDCPELTCTMMCWGGQTSTPADKETRDLRIQAHALFDNLNMSKGKRYRWMQKQMGISPRKAHIGMFNAQQCKQLIGLIQENENTDIHSSD